MEILNELFVLIQAYVTLTILYSESADMSYIQNELLTGIIRFQLIINMIFLIRTMVVSWKDTTKKKQMKKHGMSWQKLKEKR